MMKNRKTKIKGASYVIAKIQHTWFNKLMQIMITMLDRVKTI